MSRRAHVALAAAAAAAIVAGNVAWWLVGRHGDSVSGIALLVVDAILLGLPIAAYVMRETGAGPMFNRGGGVFLPESRQDQIDRWTS